MDKKNQQGLTQEQISSVIALISSGQTQEALDAAEVLIKDYPDESVPYNICGACYAGLGQFDTAVKNYKKSLAIKPDYAEAHNNLAGTLQELGQLDDAVKSYEQALSIKPNFAEAHNNLGNVLKDLGQLNAAVKSFKKAIVIKPDYVEAHYSLGTSFQELGQLDDAVKSYKEVIVIQPDFSEIHNNLGVILNKLNQNDDALKSFERAVDIKPNFAEAHNNLGITLKELGQLDDAVKSYERVLAIKPDYAEAHNNLGIALKELGQLDTAVKSYKKALAIKPDYADAHNNLGISLHKLGQLDEAFKCYEKAIDIKPDFTEAHNNLGNVLKDLGQFDAAIKSYEKVLAIKPDFAEAHNNLGIALMDLGQLDAAVKHYEQALAIKPDYADAHNTLGIALKELGQLDAAVECYEQALAIKPDYADAHFNLACVLIDLRRLGEAVKSYESSLSFDLNNNFNWAVFSKNLSDLEFLEFSDTTASCLFEALKNPIVEANDLIKPITSILRHNPTYRRVFEVIKSSNFDEKLNYLTEQLSTIPMLLLLMELCPISDPELEKLLIKIRLSTFSHLSDNHISSSSFPFYEALALHCFTNEYVFLESNEETLKVNQLENEISTLISGKEHIPVLKITLLASYRPLHIFSWAEKLLESDSIVTLQKIIIRQITEVREEQQLRSQIPEINVTENKISQVVRKQYEDNPYPRWINLGLSFEPKTIREAMKDLRVNLDLNENQFSTSPKILIAGCGTGRHSLMVASSFQNSSVLAVDLSLSSLSYAIRKTKELSIANIDYMQGDILKLNKLNRKFDIIESAGVLHHMEEPLVGWQVLVGLLKPQGLMRIGLYSQIARQNIVEIREFIAKKNYDNSPKDIRECRSEIMNMTTDSNSRIQTIINSYDFYSLSSCRDLLFHVQEHRFTLPQIANALEKMGLTFIGFDCSPQIKNQFKAQYPNNEDLFSLQLWHQFEQDHPDAFIHMYQFWVQKI